jgi:proline iminopeptidase
MTEQTDPNVHNSGYLDVGDGHSLYWEDWGNENAPPIFHIHGGPGSGFTEKHKLLYDPHKHRVIFHDQRGAGRSTPFAETAHNTTQDLIEDIEKLRTQFGLEKIYISGGSWGSTLSLFYALAHPERVDKIFLWSVFLARQFEVDFVNEGYPKYFLPLEWQRFIALVPEEHRANGDAVMQYYADQIRSSDESVARKFANEWTLWETVLLKTEYDPEATEKSVLEDKDNMAVAKLETHYFLHKCFVPENYIFDNLEKIKHIPCLLTHGRFDMCTPAIAAADLAAAYGDKLELQWVNSGHSYTDPEMNKTLKTRLVTFV